MAPTKVMVVDGVGTMSGAVRPLHSTVVVINAPGVCTISLCDRASLHNTTYQPGFSITSEKNT